MISSAKGAPKGLRRLAAALNIFCISPGAIFKLWNGKSVAVKFLEAEIHETRYYYYEDDVTGTFISTGKAR
jgi:hypothetical protein